MSLCVTNSRDSYQSPNQYYCNSLSLKVNQDDSEDKYVNEKSQIEYSFKPNQTMSYLTMKSRIMTENSPYMKSPQMANYPTMKLSIDDIYSQNLIGSELHNEDEFLPIDTSNSNCRDNFFLPNSNQSLQLNKSSYLVNENEGEKKFISELHINIKEPSLNDGDNKYIKNLNPDTNVTNYTTVHTCNLQSYVGDQENDYEYDRRNSSSSEMPHSRSESPVVKKECHLSEKFIYLGGDPRQPLNLENQKYELHSYHSPIELIDDQDQQYSVRSDESIIEDISKSYSAKSVQTSKKLDCIFKKMSDKCIETEIIGVPFKIVKEVPKEILTKNKSEYRERSHSYSGSNDLSAEYSYSTDEKQHKFKIANNHEHEQKHHNTNYKQPKNYLRNVSKVKTQPQHIESNQDTDIGSYSESFVRSNESYSIGKEEIKSCKFVPNKQSVRRPEMVKSSKSSVYKGVAKAKNSKRFSERKEINKSFETIKNNLCNEGKSKVNNKVEGERHSYEIQCLLDNLNIHLQNTVNSHKTKIGPSKSNVTQFNNTSSFWDNPLNPETSRSFFLNKQATPKILEMGRHKTVNPEIQALFETLEKSHNKAEKGDNSNIRSRKSPKLDLNQRNSKLTNSSMNEIQMVKKCMDSNGSVDNLNDIRFPSNLKFQKSFELSPYDELVKSHINSADRRIKSVAAKNGCQIVIDGPISLTDPTSTCQAIRNKIAYRCVVAGSTKDRLDKCLNYLKETFPNTCLRLHNRNNVAVKT